MVVAKMVFKTRLRSPTYYWMILAPLIFGGIGLGILKYTQSQNEAHRPLIAVVGNQQVRNTLTHHHSKTYRINPNVTTTDPKRLRADIDDGVVDGVLKVDQHFEQVSYQYDGGANVADPLTALQKDLSQLKAASKAQQFGLSAQQWQSLQTPAKIKAKNIANQQPHHLKRQAAQNFSELMVVAAFLFLTSYISITGAELGNEKGNHLIEGIIAAIPARHHFAGKMLGIGGLLGFQVIIYLLLWYLGTWGLTITHHSAWLNFTKQLSGIDWQYLVLVITMMVLAVALYILLAALFASFISRTEDISQATSSVATIMMIPYFLSFVAQSNPNLFLIRLLSWLPFMNQGLFPVRLALGATTYSVGWFVVGFSTLAVVGMYLLSQKVYAENIFSYSNRSVLQQLSSWLFKH